MAPHVIVLGGGITGLTCGYLLARDHGFHITVIEKQPMVGGISAGIEAAGYKVDFGPHRFQTRDDRVRRFFFDALDGKVRTLDTKKIAIYFKGAFLAYPLMPFDLLKKLPAADIFRYAFGRLGAALSGGSKSGDDLASYLLANRGQAAYEDLFRPFAEKIWGLDPSALDSEIERQRVILLSIRELLKSLWTKGEQSYTDYQRTFHYPEQGGIGAFPEALAAKIEALGGRVIVGREPVQIMHQDGKVSAVVLDDRERLPCDFVHSTIPLADLYRALEQDSAPCRELKYRGLRFYNAVLARERLSDNHMIYFPQKHIAFHRIGEQKNFIPSAFPLDRTVISPEVGYDPRDKASLEGGEKKVSEDLQEVFGLAPEEILSIAPADLPFAYPQYRLGYRKVLDRALGKLGSFENLITNGRQGLFRLNNMDHAIEMGRIATRFIAQPEGVWSKQIQRFEEFKIID